MIDLRDCTEKETWLELHRLLLEKGTQRKPRGLNTLEVKDLVVRMNPFHRYSNFAERKLSLKYMCAEFLWYLRGNPREVTIARYARFWDKVFDRFNMPEGPWAWSNYGYYIFHQGQLLNCVKLLQKDPHTRQASMIIATAENFMIDTTDKICTYSVNFSARDGLLDMRVNMRSNDFFFGFQNDFFQFSLMYELVLMALGLGVGDYVHHVESFHAYERHFPILESVVGSGGSSYHEISPRPLSVWDRDEAFDIIINRYISTAPLIQWMKELTRYDEILNIQSTQS